MKLSPFVYGVLGTLALMISLNQVVAATLPRSGFYPLLMGTDFVGLVIPVAGAVSGIFFLLMLRQTRDWLRISGVVLGTILAVLALYYSYGELYVPERERFTLFFNSGVLGNLALLFFGVASVPTFWIALRK